MSKQEVKKTTLNLSVTPMDLGHLRFALEMDINMYEDQLKEKKALLKLIIQLEKASKRADRFIKRGRKSNVVNMKTDPRAEAADVIDKPAS